MKEVVPQLDIICYQNTLPPVPGMDHTLLSQLYLLTNGLKKAIGKVTLLLVVLFLIFFFSFYVVTYSSFHTGDIFTILVLDRKEYRIENVQYIDQGQTATKP